MLRAGARPSPTLQGINAALHREPVSSLVHAFYWCIFLVVCTPVAIVVLLLRALVRVILWLAVGNQRGACDPENPKQKYQMAVVITGCDGGFGRELALSAVDAGYVVFAGCLEKQKSWQGPLPDGLIPLQMDVTKDDQVAAAVKSVEVWLKSEDDKLNDEAKKERVLHALINNAGVGTGGLIDWADLSDFQFCIDVNFISVVRCCKAFLPILKLQAVKRTYRDMRIFNLTSMAGLVSGQMGFSAYAASKHAANAFSSCLRMELKMFGIQVTTVNPSFHATPLVESMQDRAFEFWARLAKNVQDEYGHVFSSHRPAFFERYCFATVDIPRTVTWNMNVVVDEILKCLKSKATPPDLLIGTDARYLIPILRLVPEWCKDVIVSSYPPIPLPAVMEKNT